MFCSYHPSTRTQPALQIPNKPAPPSPLRPGFPPPCAHPTFFSMASNAAPSSSAAPQDALYVGNLAFHTTAATLEEFFRGFGPLAEPPIIALSTEQKSLGYAFVRFGSVLDAKRVRAAAFWLAWSRPCALHIGGLTSLAPGT
jgi:hypothetical protein